MTFADEKGRAGKRYVQMVDVELDFCQLEYGVAPCQAVLGTDSQNKCFNTFETCADTENYTPAIKTYRFIQPNTGLPRAPSAEFVVTIAVLSSSPQFLTGYDQGVGGSIAPTTFDGHTVTAVVTSGLEDENGGVVLSVAGEHSVDLFSAVTIEDDSGTSVDLLIGEIVNHSYSGPNDETTWEWDTPGNLWWSQGNGDTRGIRIG